MTRDTTLRDYLIDEYVEDYIENHMTRRDALKRIGAVTGSLFVAQGILAACSPAPQTPSAAPSAPAAAATATMAPPAPMATSAPPSPTAAPLAAGQTISPTDPAIQATELRFPGKAGTLLAHLARPQGAGPFPAVLICHENRGINEHTRDIARRFAKAGYVGLSLDLLSREGGTEKLEAAGISGVLGNPENAPRFVEDFQSGMQYLQEQSFVRRDRIGMTGFCFGGGITWRVAAKTPDLKAAVPFYGPHPVAADLAGITAPILAMYGANDTRINAGIEATEAALKAAGKTYEKTIYPGAGHAFFNDTGQNYNADAAKDAWVKMLAWFDKYLKA